MPRFATRNLLFVLTVSLLLSACSRQGLYDTAIGLERSMSGLEADTLVVGELTIAYLRNEQPVDGETIVMIHGFGANKDNWTRLAKHLTGDFNVYAIDLPGHGDSSKPLDIKHDKLRPPFSSHFSNDDTQLFLRGHHVTAVHSSNRYAIKLI